MGSYSGESDGDPRGVIAAVQEFELAERYGGFHGLWAAPATHVHRTALIMAAKGQAQEEMHENAKSDAERRSRH